MRIVIPTLGRIHKQITFERMPDNLKSKVVFVVQKHEYDEFARKWGKYEIAKLPKQINRIGATRQWIWEQFSDERFAMLDDDLKLRRRDYKPGEDVEWPSCYPEPEEWNRVFEWAEQKMDSGIPVCACRTADVPPTPACHPETDNVRIYTNIMFDAPALESEWNFRPDYTRVNVGEDFDVLLQIMSQGIPSSSLTQYNTHQKETGAEGGCELWRDVEVHNEDMRRLAELWPGYVTLKEKFYGSGGNMSGQSRLSASVQWKKCFKDGQSRRNLDSLGLF